MCVCVCVCASWLMVGANIFHSNGGFFVAQRTTSYITVVVLMCELGLFVDLHTIAKILYTYYL